MARTSKNRSRKPYIIIFWEGQSEQEYFKYFRNQFHDSVNLNIHNKKGLFKTADKAFGNAGVYSNYKSEVDEIWLVFDTEVEMRPQWDTNWKIVTKLRKKCKNASVKLFMTKGCIEYFFLLHYEKTRPFIITAQDKDVILKRLSRKDYCENYKKGDKETTWKIAERYKIAIENGRWVMMEIADELEDSSSEDDIIKKLYFADFTFTNAFQAIEHLLDIQEKVIHSKLS